MKHEKRLFGETVSMLLVAGSLAILAACTTSAEAAGNITVETYTLAGVASIAHQNQSGTDHVPVNVTGIGSQAECTALKNDIESSVIDLESTMRNGTVQAGLIRFSGFCVKVKQFVFAPNLF